MRPDAEVDSLVGGRGGVLAGIIDEIEEHLLDRRAVGQDHRTAVRRQAVGFHSRVVP